MINERGIWLDKRETDSHMFDAKLCAAISFLYQDIKTIVDIGCGNGAYVKQLREYGFDCVGYDGSPRTPEITGGVCGVKDFSEPQNVGKFDIVLSLEVGEHIPAEYETIFIDNLCRASKKHICMSWAIEGQNGLGHYNCRNNDYIIDKMRERGFTFDKESSEYLRINCDEVNFPWFPNTLMAFYQ
jgi:SAM-dependent methyltransferase